MKRQIFLTVFLLSVIQLASAQPATTDQVNGFIRKATELQLAQHPAWLALLHYKRETLSGHVISQADDDRFFLSESGRTQPQAELEADIKAFLQPAASGHTQCGLPARWFWLKQQLAISSKYDVACPLLDAWLANVATQKLTLVFPSMYLGNPGSMFGHTFLRFDGDEALLLSQALNYAAAIDPDDNLLSYAYNGLFGGYRGVFLMRSYFETVQLYSHIENRDIWEYQLDYSPAEIKQLARHAWELIDIRFDYFFFRENCSYRLLAMLDAVRPQAALTAGDAFLLSAIPVDTVRALDEKNLVKEKHYRPSLASQLKADFSQHKVGETKWVLQLAEGKQAVTDIIEQLEDESQQIAVLEQAYTLLQFRRQVDGSRAEEILSVRSRLTEKKSSHEKTLISPEMGHASARFAFGAGEQNKRSYVEFILRPAFHDLVDAPLGYVEGSEINVMDARFRWFTDDDLLLLESLRFLNVVSLNPVSDWYTPLSWQLDIGLERTWFDQSGLDKNNLDMAFVTRGGGGYSYGFSGTTVFAMAVLEAGVSDDYEKSYSALVGAQAGASILFEGGQALLLAETDEAFSGFELDKTSISAELQFNLTVNNALRLVWRRTRYEALNDKNWDDEDWSMRWQFYF